MENQDKQLFAYQKEELMAEESVREAHRIALRQAKALWREGWGFSKRSWRPQLLVKITADDLYVGAEACQEFENRVISY